MNNYWKNYYESVSKKFDGSLLKQVGKTVNGQDIPQIQVRLITENIVNVLHLSLKDSLVDLCCGNGLITRKLAPLVKEVVAVDYTLGLIDTAKSYNSFSNIKYVNSDVLSLNHEYFLGFKKIAMYEALQYFSIDQFTYLLNNLNSLEQGSLVFLGSIPNKVKLNAYYDTKEKYAYYMQCKSEGKPHIGRWWLMEEIELLASSRGFNVTFLSQEPALYTAHYRFNVLLEKCP